MGNHKVSELKVHAIAIMCDVLHREGVYKVDNMVQFAQFCTAVTIIDVALHKNYTIHWGTRSGCAA